ncbi:MAG TPA: chalcone isomerase family protein [Thermoanaerobaculia bacterium]|nr:chalcone isomerase family protein [Thermoanaerobaculia bacterium]
MRVPFPALILCFALLAIPTLRAAELAGVRLPDRVIVDGKCLALNGLGIRTKFMVKVYVGGLYVEQPSSDATTLIKIDGPKRLVLRFLYTTSKTQSVEAFREGFGSNAVEYLAAHRDDVDRFLARVDGIRKGEEMILTYVPSRGTTLSIRGRDRVTMPGADFMRAVFSIWLGPKPPTTYLKVGLLQPVRADAADASCKRDCPGAPKDACGCCVARSTVAGATPRAATAEPVALRSQTPPASTPESPTIDPAAAASPRAETSPASTAESLAMAPAAVASPTLLLIATEDCTVVVDADPAVAMSQDEVRKITVSLPGDHLVRARRKSDGATFQILVRVEAAEQKAVELSFPEAAPASGNAAPDPPPADSIDKQPTGSIDQFDRVLYV